jgi:hypothetical protein
MTHFNSRRAATQVRHPTSVRGLVACISQGCLPLCSSVIWSCAPTPELVPLVPHQDGMAVVQTSGLELSAKVEPGSHAVPNTLVPIKIVIVNRAPGGVYVSLDDIELELEGAGQTSEAVPPQRIRARRPVGLGIDPTSPFASQAPTSATGVASPGGSSLSETSVGYAAGKSAAIDPVKREILNTAFWGGYIKSGATQQGLVYFTKPPNDAGRLRLRVKVRPSGGDAPIQTLEIPYFIQS